MVDGKFPIELIGENFIDKSYQQKRENRRCIEENKEHIGLEYKALKDQANQIKNGQIQILTASISVSAILWGILYNISKDALDIFPSIFYLIPLLIIIPSALIFFDKSVTSARITGFLRQIEKIQLGFSDLTYYIGYENSKSYLDSMNLKCLKSQNEIAIDLEIEKNHNHEQKLNERLMHMLLCRNNRFLCVGFISFICLIIISVIFSFYSAYFDKHFFPDYTVFALLSVYLAIFSYYTFNFLEGTLHNSDADYWNKKDKLSILIWIVIIFLPVLFVIIHYFCFKEVHAEILNFDVGLITKVVYLSSVLIIGVSIIFVIKNRGKRKQESTALEMRFEKLVQKDKNIYDLEYLGFLINYTTIFLLTSIIGIGIVYPNLYISIMYLLAYVLLYCVILLLINFKDISYGDYSVEIFEKYWKRVIEKINEHYLRFDYIETSEKEIIEKIISQIKKRS